MAKTNLTYINLSHSKMNNFPSMEPKLYQNIILMRHAERIDNFVESWRSGAARPWDPPLIDEGRSRTLSTGHKLRIQLGYPIHRVFVSPFLRCLDTASGVISAMCTLNNNVNHASKCDTTINESKIKSSIELGLCEAFNSSAIVVPPKDGEDWGFNLPELESLFLCGTVEPTYEQVNAEFPKWGETKDEVTARYFWVIHALADKYPSKNLLLITHGKALRGTLRTFLGNVKSCHVDYCGYLQLRREIAHVKNGSLLDAGKFELLTDSSDGITYTTTNDVA